MSGRLHFRPSAPVRAGMLGRVCCGKMLPSARTTLVWKRVTCAACRASIAFEHAVYRWAERNLSPHAQLDAMVAIKRRGYAAWVLEPAP